MVMRRCLSLVTTASLIAAFAGMALAEPRGRPPRLDVPYVATSHDVVTAMLRIADTRPGDIVYDLGSGDGRIVVAAVRDFNVRKAVGVDIDAHRVQQGYANAAKAGVDSRAQFVQGDVYKFDFSEATVVTMYLSPRINREIRPRILKEMRPGTRIVSHAFLMSPWDPDRTERIGTRWIFLWVVPADVAGQWHWESSGERYRLELQQEFQKVAGQLHAAGRTVPIEQAQLEGRLLRFQARLGDAVLRFAGTITGDAAAATVGSSVVKHIVARRQR